MNLYLETKSSTSSTSKRTSTSRLAAASAVGTTLEWYDFTVYNTLAALIFNRLFFPSFDPLVGTILAFSTYAVGYISRPIGGLVFGHLGDKLGRRFVLFVTVAIMGLTTALMGLLPTYLSGGILSPILLVTLRFVQGIALGGEWAGAVLISVEHGDQQRRGRNASFTQLGPALGTLLATGCIGLITNLLSPDDFLAWGWRIPLLCSLILVGFGVWIRLSVDETPMFKELEESGAKAKTPIADVLRLFGRRLLVAGGVRVGSDVHYALIAVFSLTYVTTVLNLPRTLALTAIMIGTVFNAVAIPVCGGLSDRIGRRPVYAAGTLLAMLWAFGFFYSGRSCKWRFDRDGGCHRILDPRADVWSASRLRDRTVPYTRALCRLVAGLYAGRHPWRRIRTADHGESATGLSHHHSNIVVYRWHLVRDACGSLAGARDSETSFGTMNGVAG